MITTRTKNSLRNVKTTKTTSKKELKIIINCFHSNQDEQKMDVDEGEGSQPINESVNHEKVNPLQGS